MSRFIPSAIVAGLVLSSSARVRADYAEDKAAVLAEKLGGEVSRDDTRPGELVVALAFRSHSITGADLRALAPGHRPTGHRERGRSIRTVEFGAAAGSAAIRRQLHPGEFFAHQRRRHGHQHRTTRRWVSQTTTESCA
jgi:hypothetical protein